jgi:hypothetical protein
VERRRPCIGAGAGSRGQSGCSRLIGRALAQSHHRRSRATAGTSSRSSYPATVGRVRPPMRKSIRGKLVGKDLNGGRRSWRGRRHGAANRRRPQLGGAHLCRSGKHGHRDCSDDCTGLQTGLREGTEKIPDLVFGADKDGRRREITAAARARGRSRPWSRLPRAPPMGISSSMVGLTTDVF